MEDFSLPIFLIVIVMFAIGFACGYQIAKDNYKDTP